MRMQTVEWENFNIVCSWTELHSYKKHTLDNQFV